ncbi:MAG TPA: rhodanese-like domain-containing protein [Phaeodactylibacter sp.]|nr:rhodanese-like domain-containing protein [Phaeodactylibacter sp.]
MFGILNQMFDNGTQADIKAMVEDGALLLDVRTPSEFNNGHAKGAVNIPLQELNNHIAEIKAKGKPVVAYCRSGNRSGMAAQLLQRHKIEAVNAGSLGQVNARLA